MLAVFVGSGVGGGIIVNGSLYHGAHGGAGEIGHMVVRAGGPRCGCGRAGCLEAMAARDAVARYVAQEVRRGHRSVLSDILHGTCSRSPAATSALQSRSTTRSRSAQRGA